MGQVRPQDGFEEESGENCEYKLKRQWQKDFPEGMEGMDLNVSKTKYCMLLDRFGAYLGLMWRGSKGLGRRES